MEDIGTLTTSVLLPQQIDEQVHYRDEKGLFSGPIMNVYFCILVFNGSNNDA